MPQEIGWEAVSAVKEDMSHVYGDSGWDFPDLSAPSSPGPSGDKPAGGRGQKSQKTSSKRFRQICDHQMNHPGLSRIDAHQYLLAA
eukprot:12409101-Karenia_brevis.AAC.1